MAKDDSNPWGKARPKLDDNKSKQDDSRSTPDDAKSALDDRKPRQEEQRPQGEDRPSKPKSSWPKPETSGSAPAASETRARKPARKDNDRKPAADRDRPARRRDEKPERTRDSRPGRTEGKRAERPANREHPAFKDAPRRDRDAPAKDKPAFKERAPRFDELDEVAEHFPRADRGNEVKIYGVNACMAAFKRHKENIIRGYFSQTIAGKFGETMRFLAQEKKAYRVVEDDELEKITQSTHHGGVCFLMKKRQPMAITELLSKIADRPSVCLLILEGVRNPHNLGAMLRSCANFEVPAVLVDNANLMQSGAAARVAEGGAEWVDLVEYDNIPNLLEQLRAAGFSILATSSHQGRDLYRTELPAKTAIFFGEEAQGLKSDTLKSSELCVRIPGSSNVESLNVSAASGIILGEFWRQHKSGSRTAKAMAPASAQPQGGRLKLKKGSS